jgi:hypothetical protein
MSRHLQFVSAAGAGGVPAGRVGTLASDTTGAYTTGKFNQGIITTDWGFLKSSVTTALNFNTSPWTIEYWVYIDSGNRTSLPIIRVCESTSFDQYSINLSIEYNANQNPKFLTQNFAYNSADSARYSNPRFAFDSAAAWYHIALVADGATILTYINGTGYSGTSLVTLKSLSQPTLQIYPNAGILDEVRISNTARYTSGFTPSGSAFTSDASTVALYHFDNTLSDDYS